MSLHHFDKLFAPQSIALIGASRDAASVGGVLARNLTHAGYKGALWLVNPKATEVAGQPAYKSIAALPTAPELAVIATPPAAVPGTLKELARRGTRATVIVTAGFETPDSDGAAIRRKMRDATLDKDMRIVGPNCLGVMVPHLGINASFAHLDALPGKLAFVTQSGAVITTMLDWAAPRGIGFSHVVSLGNMVDVDFGDMLDYLALDHATDAILLYIESLRDARKFMSAARAAARAKPVIVVKAGRNAPRRGTLRSERAPSDDAVFDAAFRRAGMLRVADLDELFEAATTLATGKRIHGDRLAIIGNGVALGVLATDALDEAGGRLASLSKGSNPIDVTGEADAQRYLDALLALDKEDGVDAVLVLNAPSAIVSREQAAKAVAQAAAKLSVPVLASWLGSATTHAARQHFLDAHLPSFETPRQAVRGFMHLVNFQRNREALMETPVSMPQEVSIDLATARAVINAALNHGRTSLSDAEARQVLVACGIPVLEAGQSPVRDEQAQELSVGLRVDAVFGPVLHFAPAGIERLLDRVMALPPLNMALAYDAMRRSRIFNVLHERQPASALDAIALTLIKLGQAAIELPQIVELDIDPLRVVGASVVAINARIGLRAFAGIGENGGESRLAIKPYPRQLERQIALRDGSTATLRPVKPEDEPVMQETFDRLDKEDVRMRFFAPLGKLNHILAARLAQIDYDRQMAFVAVRPRPDGTTEGLGVVRIAIDPDHERGEYAVVVRSDLKGAGLGYLFMMAIIDYARRQGLREIFGLVLRENERMLRMARQMGFTVHGVADDLSLVEVRLSLR